MSKDKALLGLKRKDQETGLYYNRYRYYSHYVGRFVSKDPISLFGGVNLYQYVDNPIGWVDPFGLRRKRGSDTTRHGPAAVTKVNNRMPINSKGFPDFSRYARTTVNIGSFTKDDADFRSANAKIGLAGKKAPDNSVWHHTDKDGILQLIPKDIHDAVRHKGGAAICGIRKLRYICIIKILILKKFQKVNNSFNHCH